MYGKGESYGFLKAKTAPFSKINREKEKFYSEHTKRGKKRHGKMAEMHCGAKSSPHGSGLQLGEKTDMILYNIIGGHQRDTHILTRKGGEKVPSEEIKRVTEAEKTAQERKSEAVLRTKKLIGDAERAGQAHLAAVRAEAQAQAKGFMAEAEAEAAKRAAAIAEETQAACDRLRAAAEQKLPAAAELIVGRVVSV